MSPTANTSGWPARLEIRPDRDPLAALELDAERLDDRLRLQAGAPDERVRVQHLARLQRHARRRDGRTTLAAHHLDVALLERLRRVVAEVRLEHREQRRAGLDQDQPCARSCGISGIVLREVAAVQLGQRARRISTPVGPPPTTTTFRAPSSTSEGSRSAASHCPRTCSFSRTASGERVHREAVLGRALGAEEVRPRRRARARGSRRRAAPSSRTAPRASRGRSRSPPPGGRSRSAAPGRGRAARGPTATGSSRPVATW